MDPGGRARCTARAWTAANDPVWAQASAAAPASDRSGAGLPDATSSADTTLTGWAMPAEVKRASARHRRPEVTNAHEPGGQPAMSSGPSPGSGRHAGRQSQLHVHEVFGRRCCVFGTDEVGDDFTQPQSVPDVAVEVDPAPTVWPTGSTPRRLPHGNRPGRRRCRRARRSRERAAPTGVAPAG